MFDLRVYIMDAAVVVLNFYSTVQKTKLLFLTSSCVNMFVYIELMYSVKNLWDLNSADVLSCFSEELRVLLSTPSMLRWEIFFSR